MTYPGTGIGVSTGSAWGTSYTLGAGLALSGSAITTVGQGFLAPAAFVPSALTNAQVIYGIAATVSFSVATNCAVTGRSAVPVMYGATTATSSTTFTLYKNGVSFGTATVSGGANYGAFTCTATSFSPTGNSGNPDILTVKNQATADATFGSFTIFSLAGSY